MKNMKKKPELVVKKLKLLPACRLNSFTSSSGWCQNAIDMPFAILHCSIQFTLPFISPCPEHYFLSNKTCLAS